jgi:phospholipase/lecithinase/hemolysin
VKLVVLLSLALATAASAQPPPPANPLDRTQQLGGWTVSDTGSKPGDDGEREVRVARSLEGVDVVLHRSGPDSTLVAIKFSRCDGLNWNSGFALEGAVPARAAQLKDEIHDAFKDFAKHCPPKAGEEAALLEGFDAAAGLAETWIHDRPFVYPPEPAEPK